MPPVRFSRKSSSSRMCLRKTSSDFMPGNLVLDERLDVRVEAAARHESHLPAEQTFQREGQVDKIVVRRLLEVDENIDDWAVPHR